MLLTKKTLRLLMVILLLLLSSACCMSDTSNPDNPQQESITENDNAENGNDENSNSFEQEPTTESKSDEDMNPNEIKATHDRQASFTSTWAKTDAYFFFVSDSTLYRLPLNDITQGESVEVPGDGGIAIVGISEESLFVKRGEHTYRFSPATLQATLIDSGTYFGVPFFHLASNSILFAHGDFDEKKVWLEALQLDTGIRSTIYEFESHNFSSGKGWWQMENDAVVFINSSWGAAESGSDFILIDSELKAEHIQPSTEIYMQPLQPQNPGEAFVFELEPFWMRHGRCATAGDWVYYLLDERNNYSERSGFYRIGIDGTQNMLIQENADIFKLLGVNNTLFATMYTGPGEDSDPCEAVKLSPDGSIEKVIGYGWHGHNSAFGLERLLDTDMVMIMNYSYFRVDGSVQGLYCTATGALFSSYKH